MLRAEPGTTLADGRYRLQRRLGAGGMATVWLARDERLQRAVAIKLIADTLAGDESWLQRFTREARAAAALSHRGVVPVFDYGVQDGRPYLVMEYIAGGNLAQRLDGTPVSHAGQPPAPTARPAGPGAARGARRGSRRRDPAPRRQARQPAHRLGRPPAADRLRNRPDARCDQPDENRDDRRDAALHRPRGRRGQPGHRRQ